ncbi:MAG: glycoside hydrolase family 3 C-terminal domain-containing protein [Clostridiales bacterium]|nr:glycoside hydrolase family 3 C-terminal domain-containing protein [Clostridiales bacterium]
MNAPEGVQYSKGYEIGHDNVQEKLVQEALDKAKNAEKIVVFAGLPDSYESEGYDRTHMKLPENQNDLINKLVKTGKKIVVVLHNGSPVEMPWVEDVDAILETYLGGEAVGKATIDVLYGDVNPSGHLAESFPIRLQDNPSYLSFGGEKGQVNYQEGVFVGYRYYDSKEMDLLFPFGHGLSYTTFSFEDLQISRNKFSVDAETTIDVMFTIKNTGKCFGKEVVQLYVAPLDGETIRPVHELKAFEKIALFPGESKEIHFSLVSRDFAYYEESIADWYVESGNYEIQIGNSSRNILLRERVEVQNSKKLPVTITLDSPVSDVMKTTKGREVFESMVKGMIYSDEDAKQAAETMSIQMIEEMMADMPVRAMAMFSGGAFKQEDAIALISQINES